LTKASKEQVEELRARLRALRVFMAGLKDARLQDAEILLSVVEAEIGRNCNGGQKRSRR
jgi:hypothetical protein